MARRTQRDVVFVEREASSPVWWLLAGGALGAGLALLFAPEPGEKTRQLLARRLRRLRDSADQALAEFRETISDESDLDDEIVEAAEDAVEAEDAEDAGGAEDAEDADPPGDGKLPEGNARAELEKRLAAVRARRRRVFADEDEEPVA